MMKVLIAALADYASISQGNKLNVLGIFRNIQAVQVPAAHPQMYVVIQFEFESVEAGPKAAAVILEDADGNEVVSLRGPITVPRGPSGHASIFNLILTLNNVTFQDYGAYEVKVLLGDRIEAELSLQVDRVGGPAESGL
jgi:hypothetical protein